MNVEITRSESTKSEVEKGSTKKDEEKEEKKKQKGKKKKPSSGKSDKQKEMKEVEDAAGRGKESVKILKEKKETDKKERETDQTKEKKKEKIEVCTDRTEEKSMVKSEKELSKKGDIPKEKSDKKTANKKEMSKGSESTVVSSTSSSGSVEASGSRSLEDEINGCEKVKDVKHDTVKSKSKIDGAMQENMDASNSNFNEMDNDQSWSKTDRKKNRSQKKVSKEAGMVTPSGSVEETDTKLPSSFPQKGESDLSLKEGVEVYSEVIKSTPENVSISMEEKNKSNSQHNKKDNEDPRHFKQQPKSLLENVKNSKKEYESFKTNEESKDTENKSEPSRTSRSDVNIKNPWKSKVSESADLDKSKSSISNVTLKSESEKEDDEVSENLSAVEANMGACYIIQQGNANRQSADQDNFEKNDERGFAKEDIKDTIDESVSAVSFTDKTEINKDTPEMEESMYESMMEMSIAEMPTNTPSDDKLAPKEEKEGPQVVGGKSKKKKRKNKKNGI